MAQLDQVDLKLFLEANRVEDAGRVCQQLHEHGVTTLTRFAELSEGTLRKWHIDDSLVYDWALSHAQRLLRDSSHDLAAIRQQLLDRALYCACAYGNLVRAQELLSMGANVNYHLDDYYGWTPLHRSAARGHKDICNLLLNTKSVNVNAVDENGDTPLHRAAYHGYLDCVKALMSHKETSLSLHNKRGRTPLDMARDRGQKDVVKYLQKKLNAAKTRNRNLVMQYIERQGSLPVRSMKSFLIGPSCVGKTSARRRLTGEIKHISRDEIIPSTGIDAPLTVRLHHPTEHSSVLLSEGWRSQGLEEQCHALCSYALNSPTPPPALSSSRSAAPPPPPPALSSSRSAAPPPPPALFSSRSATPPPLPPPPPPASPVAARSHRTKPLSKLTSLFKQAFSRHSQPTAAQEELTTALTTLVKADDWMSIRDFLTNVKELALLHIVDIGGQPEFHEILPLLLHGLALNLIFLNTTQDLDSPYTVVYRDGTGNDNLQYTSEFTIRQVIQRALCTISSLQTSESNKPAAILIGTYCDCVDKSAVLALDQSIQESFKEADFMKKDVLCAVSKPGEKRRYIHPLDNISGDPSEIDELRQLISTIVHERFTPVMVPTSALLLHLILRMKFGHTRGWCTLEECVQIANNCGISRDDLLREDGILQYLHDKFGTVLYYRKLTKLRLRVIVNANVIMDPPSRLFLMAFGALKTEQQTAEHIRATGEISHRLMLKVCSPDDGASDNDLPTDEIVELLKARYILFEHAQSSSNEPVYFMPALLYPDHNVAKESSNPDHLASLSFPPVVFLPSSGDVPLGQFPATAVNLSKHWKPDEKNRYRNRIRFYANFKDSILLHVELRTLSTHLEFRVLSEPSSDTSLMVESIRKLSEVFAEVSSLYSHTQNITWKVGFYCPHSLQSGQQPHTATCFSIDNPQQMICSQKDCEGRLIPLNDKHKSWFTVMPIINTTTTATPPTQELSADNVLYLLNKHKFSSAVWAKLAMSLKLSHAVDVIDKDKQDCDSKLIALVNRWVANDPDKTWNKLVSAIEMSDQKVVADKLAREVGLR